MLLDLSKYFDTLNHELLLNILRRDIHDERVIQWIKRYVKSGVMESGVVHETEEGSPLRACIWKHWKLPKTKRKNLMKLGIPEHYAHIAACSRKAYWFTSATSTVNRALSKERLIHNGFYDLSIAYQSMHVNY